MEYIDINDNTKTLDDNNSKNLYVINREDIVTILRFSKKIKNVVIEDNKNLKSIIKFPDILNELRIINNEILESIYIPNVSIKIEIYNNPKLKNIEELIEKYTKTMFYNTKFTEIKTEPDESDDDTSIAIGSELDKEDLQIEEWTFTTNVDEYKSSPSFLRNESKFLISYKDYKGYSYPIITIPKGTILYNYGKGNNITLKDKYHNIYNLEKEQPFENQLKFFYPVPYAANLGIDTKYNICNIVVTNNDIQLICLLSPAPQSNETLRLYSKHKVINEMIEGYNYYENGLTKKCEAFEHDLCLNLQMMKEMNVQGYICISKQDSISNGETWYKNMDNESMKNYKEYIEEYLLSSCLTSIYRENNNLNYINEKLNLKIPENLKNRMFGVPEIVIVPLKTEYFYNIAQDKVLKTFDNIKSDKEFEYKESEINNIFKNIFNYQVLEICDLTDLKSCIEKIEHNILSNKQCQILQLFSPELVIKEISTNLRYEKPNFDDVNYILSYLNENTKNPYCAFETVRYHVLDKSSYGKRKTVKNIKKKNNKSRVIRKYKKTNLFTTSDRKTIKITGGGYNTKIIFERTKCGIPIAYTVAVDK